MSLPTKELKSLFVITLLIGVIVLPIQTLRAGANGLQDPQKTSADRQYWAFIVGIGQYADHPEDNRPDMILEANDFRSLLLQSPWWSPDHIRLLTAENATRSNIIAGFRWLSKMASKDDVVVVYLSTHGNYLPFDIPPRDEADTLDEMLVTYWGFAYNTSFITDDTINILLNKVRSENVCLIVDSCYAGGFNDHWRLLKASPEQHRVILMGSCEDELSYSGGFAPYLIDAFRGYADTNGDGMVSAEEAFAYAQPRSMPRQTPTMYDGYPGDLIITASSLGKASSSFVPSLPNPAVTSAETAVLCGYVTSSNQPVDNAVVSVSGRINYQDYYTNSTTSDPTGFYFMHLPTMRIRITASAYGFCDKNVGQLQVVENQTYWVNISLLPHPPENAVLRGRIISLVNQTPVPANVTLRWYGTQDESYRNITVAASDGFYQMSVAAGQVDLEFMKEGFFSESRDSLNITDSQTLWLNISLCPLPEETATVSGYVTEAGTGTPFAGIQVDINWFNYTIDHEYSREAVTDAAGFYSVHIAPGELYIDLRGMEYSYNDPYRHEGVAGETLWMNMSLQQDSVSVTIAKPLRALYVNNHRLVPWESTRIIGPIDVQATSAEDFYGQGNWQVQKVEFYLDGTLEATVTADPYLWSWTKPAMGRHTIKVVAYGLHNDTASREIEVSKFL